MARANEADTGLRNHIAQGTKIQGDVVTEGDLRIDGELQGSIDCKGKLVIGNTGAIKGEVKCQNANLAGSIEGTCVVTEMITVQSTGKFSGELVYGKMSVEPGAQLEGTFNIAGKLKDMKHGRSEASEQRKEKTA
tara:strand:+ start:9750 stop:10154 length:405 start_codon:yes stop_codon:yes gene_type:complete